MFVGSTSGAEAVTERSDSSRRGLAASIHLDRFGHPVCDPVISNIPGVKEPRYLNGARLVGIYPVSALGTSVG